MRRAPVLLTLLLAPLPAYAADQCAGSSAACVEAGGHIDAEVVEVQSMSDDGALLPAAAGPAAVDCSDFGDGLVCNF